MEISANNTQNIRNKFCRKGTVQGRCHKHPSGGCTKLAPLSNFHLIRVHGRNFQEIIFLKSPKKAKYQQIYSIIRPCFMKNVDTLPILFFYGHCPAGRSRHNVKKNKAAAYSSHFNDIVCICLSCHFNCHLNNFYSRGPIMSHVS